MRSGATRKVLDCEEDSRCSRRRSTCAVGRERNAAAARRAGRSGRGREHGEAGALSAGGSLSRGLLPIADHILVLVGGTYDSATGTYSAQAHGLRAQMELGQVQVEELHQVEIQVHQLQQAHQQIAGDLLIQAHQQIAGIY